MNYAYAIALVLEFGCGLPWLTGCQRAQAPLYSPDRSMMLVASIERNRQDPAAYLCVVFEIRSTNGTVLHRENTRASSTMRWSLSWADNVTVRLNSGDIGDYEWQRKPDGTWTKPERNKPPNTQSQ